MGDLLVSLAYVFGGLLVAIYSYFAFNSPEYVFEEADDGQKNYGTLARPGLPRYMTEKFRYHMYCSFFVLFALVQYLLLAQLLPIIPGVEGFINSQGDNKPLIDAAMALGSALLLLGVVNFVKWPRIVLFDFMKGWLHSFASIPEMGRRVFCSLCYAQINYDSDEVKARIETLLQKNYLEESKPRQDLEKSDFCVGNAKTIIWKWARLSYLVNLLEEWNNQPIFTAQLRESSLGWVRLRKTFIDLIDDVIRARKGQLNEEQKVHLNDGLDELLANFNRLMACLVIMVATPTADPFDYIRKAGYLVVPGAQFTAKPGEVFRVISVLVPAIALSCILLMSVLPGNTELRDYVSTIFVYLYWGMIILVSPIVIVLFAKRHLSMQGTWPIVTKNNPYRSFFEMPLLTYTVISLLAFIVSTTIIMVTRFWSTIDNPQSWAQMAVFCFISAITAFFVAYRTDIPPRIYPTYVLYTLNRLKGAALQGALTAMTVWIGLILFHPGMALAKMLGFPAMGFFVGAILHFSLFYGKHHVEKRCMPRSYVSESITAEIAGVRMKADVVNRSELGVGLKIFTNYLAAKGSEIELIMPNDRRINGKVEWVEGGEMFVLFPKGQQAATPAFG